MINHRLRVAPISFDWSPEGNIFHLPRFPIRLWKWFKLESWPCFVCMRAAQIHVAKCWQGDLLGRISMGRENPVQYGGRRIWSPFTTGSSNNKLVRKLVLFLNVLFCVAGTGYTYQSKFLECILFRLKAVVLSAHRMVRTESSRRWICKLQRAKILQCKICDLWRWGFRCSHQGYQDWRRSFHALQNPINDKLFDNKR